MLQQLNNSYLFVNILKSVLHSVDDEYLSVRYYQEKLLICTSDAQVKYKCSIPVQLLGLWSWNHVENHFNIINGYIDMFSTRFQEIKITLTI
ncbi:hypothetical protein T09_6595 [Trichinella sp. T9]|nr:hypothetical protein T09_6595 [Trichinella sp. T9]